MQAATYSTGTTESRFDTGGLGGHPSGLTTLFFTEMWERFSYYGMRAILVLYMVAPLAQGGLGFSTALAASIYGTYTMFVYVTSIPGGFIADRFLGARMSVLIGGIIIALGHFTLAIPQVQFFYAGLLLIVLGTGLLKPNISSMLGTMYSEQDERRDAGFSIFYMGINIGAAVAPLVCGYLAQSEQFKGVLSKYGLDPHSSWHWGFAAAGIGMTLGLTQYIAQRAKLKGAGRKPRVLVANEVLAKEPLNQQEWMRIGALGVLFFFTMLFWSGYEQGGLSLNLFADRLTRNQFLGMDFPSSWYQSVPATFVILLAPVFSWLWIKLGDKQPSSPAKFTFGLALLGIGTLIMVPASILAASGKVSPWWLMGCYFFQVCGELCLSPVGLSTVTKLAPMRFVSLTMGCWFLAAALGNKLAGYFGGFFNASDPQALITLFGGLAGVFFISTIILAALTPQVRKLMSGVH